MELNRNQYFFAGILLVLIGVQFRMVASYELTSEATRLLSKKPQVAASTPETPFGFASAPSPPLAVTRKVIRPPNWLGWCLISVGAVLVLHSLSMKKPE